MKDLITKTQELSQQIDALYKIENDEKAKTLERIEARDERIKLTRELNDLLQSAVDSLDGKLD